MTLELAAAGIMLIALAVYALTAGADFGGGFWDLVARGPRADVQRRSIEHAIAPIWEANHVWLIFVIVVLFTAFPVGFARLGTELHVPLTLMLVGIVMRGSAFVFRQYGGGGASASRSWGLVFGLSSVISPLMLGCVLGAMTTGHAWFHLFPLSVGLLAIAAFAFLASVYLTVEVTSAELRADFTRRATVAASAVILLGGVVALLAHSTGTRFGARLVGSWWSAPLIVAAVSALAASVVALRKNRHATARANAVLAVATLIVGWGLAQYPMLFAPDLTIANAAAPHATLRVLFPIVAGGSLILVPSLWMMLRVFKSR